MIDISDFFDIGKVEVNYIVKEEDRVVICIITSFNDIPLRLEKYGLADDKYGENEVEVRKYKGVAKCSPEDPWDERYGKRLAEYRAQKKRMKDINGELFAFIKAMGEKTENLYKYGFIKEPKEPKRGKR